MQLVGRRHELRRAISVLDEGGPTAVVIHGAAGLGKTRIMQEVARRRPGGAHVEAIVGSPGLSAVPLGAVGHLLPADGDLGVTQLIAAAHAELRRRTGNRRLLLAVDDAHDLDEATAGIVHQLVALGEAAAIIAVRSGEKRPEAIDSIWRGPDTERLELEPLDADETRELVVALLDGDVDSELSERVAEITGGHPLLITLVVESAIATGAVVHQGGRWCQVGDLATESAHELVSEQLSRLPPDEREALAALAVVEPIGRDGADLIGRQVIERLVARRVVGVEERSSAADVVTIAHPMIAEAARDLVGAGDRQRVLRAFAAWAAQDDISASTAVLVRLGRGAVEEGLSIDAEFGRLAGASLIQVGDVATAAELLLTAIDTATASGRDVPPSHRLLAARALAGQGRVDEAFAQLDRIDDESPAVRADVALERAHASAFVAGDPASAVRVLAGVAPTLPSDLAMRLDGLRALLSAMVGDFEAVFEICAPIADDIDVPPAARLPALINLTLARAMTGRLESFDRQIEVAQEFAAEQRATNPVGEVQVGGIKIVGLIVAGRFDDAAQFLEVFARERDAEPMYLSGRAEVEAYRGDIDGAAAGLDRALDILRDADPLGIAPQVAGRAALAHAWQRTACAIDLDAGRSAAAGQTRSLIWVGRAEAWRRAPTDPVGGFDIVVREVRAAFDHDHITWGAFAAHDVVRWRSEPTHLDAAADLLREAAAATTDADLITALSEHAAAVAGGDISGLRRAAERFSAMGAHVLAAESWAQAAALGAAMKPESPEWCRAAMASLWVERRCPGLRTPPIEHRPQALTERQLGVVDAVGSGRSSREIAEALFVSVRTVDNHLSAVYRTLGLSGRTELVDLARRHGAVGFDD